MGFNDYHLLTRGIRMMCFRRRLVNCLIGSTVGLIGFVGAEGAFAAVSDLPDVEWNQGEVDAYANPNGIIAPSSETKPIDGPGGVIAGAAVSVVVGDDPESGTASAIVKAALAPSPSLYASAATNSVDALAEADSDVQLTYQVEIIGAPGLVDLRVQAASSSSSSATSSSADTELNLELPIGGVAVEYIFETDSQLGAAAGGFAESFNLDTTYTTQADSPFVVSMQVSASSGNDETGSGSATAELDPIFSVPIGYSIVFSPGVGNSPIAAGVPEPSTWALMTLGFAGLGFASWRRRVVAQSASPDSRLPRPSNQIRAFRFSDRLWTVAPKGGTDMKWISVLLALACSIGLSTGASARRQSACKTLRAMCVAKNWANAQQCQMLYEASIKEGGVWMSPAARIAAKVRPGNSGPCFPE
ncbi:MAG TPA: PEP-CTERM sorting domain-containing protein [Roseiarcus sp.]|jgi:hypothetical protein